MLKVLADPEVFFYGRCGMVRYYSVLFSGLRQRAMEVMLPLMASNSDFINGKYQQLSGLKTFPFGTKLYNKINSCSLYWYRREVAKGNYDVLFVTSPVFDDTFLNYLPAGKPFVLVVHDTMRCVPGVVDCFFDASGSHADKLAYLARRASKIVCVSHSTKTDLLQLVEIEDRKVLVIPTANLLNTMEEQQTGIRLPQQYLLFAGERTGRKNFRFFIKAVSNILRDRNITVVCTGKGTAWEHDFLQSLNIQDKVLFLEAPDPVLVHLYKHALALVYPSLYEGFGLPVLEALSLGCPVITSAIGGLSEVGGDVVCYIDPHNAASIADGVNAVITDAGLRNDMKKNGLKQANLFTLDKMIANFEQMIKTICSEPS